MGILRGIGRFIWGLRYWIIGAIAAVLILFFVGCSVNKLVEIRAAQIVAEQPKQEAQIVVQTVVVPQTVIVPATPPAYAAGPTAKPPKPATATATKPVAVANPCNSPAKKIFFGEDLRITSPQNGMVVTVSGWTGAKANWYDWSEISVIGLNACATAPVVVDFAVWCKNGNCSGNNGKPWYAANQNVLPGQIINEQDYVYPGTNIEYSDTGQYATLPSCTMTTFYQHDGAQKSSGWSITVINPCAK